MSVWLRLQRGGGSLSTDAAPGIPRLFRVAAHEFNDRVCGGGGRGAFGASQRLRRQGHGLAGVCGGPGDLRSGGGAAAQCAHSGLDGDRRDIAGCLRGGGGSGAGEGQPRTGTTKKGVIAAVTGPRRRPSTAWTDPARAQTSART